MESIGNAFTLVISHLKKFLFVFAVGFLLNLACFLIYYYLFESLHTSTITVTMFLLFLVLFPAIFAVAAYRYLAVSMMRTVYIKSNPTIQKLMLSFSTEAIRYSEQHASGEKNDKVYRLGAYFSDKFGKMPGIVKRRIINKLDSVPVTSYLRKIPTKKMVPGNEAEVSEELFALTNAFVLSELLPAQAKFLYWLIPLNIIFFILSLYFFS